MLTWDSAGSKDFKTESISFLLQNNLIRRELYLLYHCQIGSIYIREYTK